MVILNYRSPYLRRILSTNKKKNDGTLAHIKLPNVLPETFHIILRFVLNHDTHFFKMNLNVKLDENNLFCRYIYGGRISPEEYDTLDIIKILKAASEFSLQELISHLQSFLIENKTNWMEQNFSLVYQASFEHDSFLELQKFCTDIVTDEPDKIFKSADFTSIPEKPLVALIQNSKFQMSEVQVWEYVLKWGACSKSGTSF
jgi:BTB And C-terminal Kelch/BTB/POZ domain